MADTYMYPATDCGYEEYDAQKQNYDYYKIFCIFTSNIFVWYSNYGILYLPNDRTMFFLQILGKLEKPLKSYYTPIKI